MSPSGHTVRAIHNIARTPGFLAEAKGQIVVASGLEDGERAFQMLPRFAALSDEPMRHSGCAVSDSGLGRIGSRPDVAQEGLGVSPHRRQFAPGEATHPEPVVGRQPFGRILVGKRRLASSCECFGGLARTMPARRDQRVAVSDVQTPVALTAHQALHFRARPVRHGDRLAEVRGLIDHRREPRWIFARFHLSGAKALAEAVPVQTPGSGSDGGDPFRHRPPFDCNCLVRPIDPFAWDLLSGWAN
jgi:hypothetical protein